MKNALLAIIGKASVDTLTASFQKTIQRLAEVENRSLDRIAKRRDQIDELEIQNIEDRTEAARAATFANKLSKLIGA